MRGLLALGVGIWMFGCRQPVTVEPGPGLTPATPVASRSGVVDLPPEIDPGLEKGQLRDYYRRKYRPEEVAAVRALVEELLPSYTPGEKRQAITEILGFSYVIFHRTKYHHLDKNHAALRKHEKTLQQWAAKYRVPPLLVMAIVSWENSGGVSKVSAADAAGLGQMTWGAIETAHHHARQEARNLRQSDPASKLATHLEKIEARHRFAARQAKVLDERFVPDCNLEDVTLFLHFLLTHLGGRVDQAIGAYHKGLTNTDDILYDYLTRSGESLGYPSGDRSEFLAALETRKVTYLSLWNDTRSRQMLNGLRTMDGEVTNASNRSQALGDESDIYPWKVMGSLAAYRQGPDYLKEQIERYNPPQMEVETAGLTSYTSLAQISQALQQGNLVLSRAPLEDRGLLTGLASDSARLTRAITPELEGYLFSLLSRWSKICGRSDLQLPLKTLMNTRALLAGQPNDLARIQLRGVTARLNFKELPEPVAEALLKVLEVDFLNDRIYRSTSEPSEVLLCLNPRFGHQFLAAYHKYRAAR